MALTSASTLAEILTEYRATAGYDINASASEAGRFIIACRMLLAMRPSQAQQRSAGVSFDLARVDRQLDDALDFYATNGGDAVNGGVTHVSLGGFRQ